MHLQDFVVTPIFLDARGTKPRSFFGAEAVGYFSTYSYPSAREV